MGARPDGKPNKEIAARLSLSEDAVKRHSGAFFQARCQ
jgi:DNA-binding NarL/FixJ family response regulator